MPFSVVIPAHNEEAVIGRCLSSLMDGAPPGELEVLVVCNGCDDRTADVARQSAPNATVLEIPVASKVAALNAGDEHATHFPRFYVDADVELSYPALVSVARVLSEGGVLCAAPKPLFDLKARPWSVRAFYAVLQGVPYFSQDMVGTGVYAVSAEGRRRFGAFPELTADDQFVQQLFDRPERRSVAGAHFVVHPPANLRGVLAMRARAYRGNRELARSGLARSGPPPSGLKSVLRRALVPAEAPAVAVYTGVNILAKGLAYGRPSSTWERDDSARLMASGNGAASSPWPGPERTRVCYVTSHYPALSHTFVMREILGLRAAGLEVDTVSVHRAAAASLLADADRREADSTWNIFPLQAGPSPGLTRPPFWPIQQPIFGPPARRCGPPQGVSADIYGSCFISPRRLPYGAMPSGWAFGICTLTWPTWPPISVGGRRSSAILQREPRTGAGALQCTARPSSTPSSGSTCLAKSVTPTWWFASAISPARNSCTSASQTTGPSSA